MKYILKNARVATTAVSKSKGILSIKLRLISPFLVCPAAQLLRIE